MGFLGREKERGEENDFKKQKKRGGYFLFWRRGGSPAAAPDLLSRRRRDDSEERGESREKEEFFKEMKKTGEDGVFIPLPNPMYALPHPNLAPSNLGRLILNQTAIITSHCDQIRELFD